MIQRKQDPMISALLRSIMQEQMNEEIILDVRAPPRNIKDRSLNHLANRITEDLKIVGSSNDPARKILSELGVRKVPTIENQLQNHRNKTKPNIRRVKKVRAKKIPIKSSKRSEPRRMPMLVSRNNKMNHQTKLDKSGDFLF